MPHRGRPPPTTLQVAGRELQGFGDFLRDRIARKRAREMEDRRMGMAEERLDLARSADERAAAEAERRAREAGQARADRGIVDPSLAPATEPRIDTSPLETPRAGVGMAGEAVRGAEEGPFAGELRRRLAPEAGVDVTAETAAPEAPEGVFTRSLRNRIRTDLAPEAGLPALEGRRAVAEGGYDPERDVGLQREMARAKALKAAGLDEEGPATDPALAEGRRLTNRGRRRALAMSDAEDLARSVYAGDPEQTPPQVARILERGVAGLAPGAALGVAQRVRSAQDGTGPGDARFNRIADLVPPVTPQQELAARQLASGMAPEAILDQARGAGLPPSMLEDVERYLTAVIGEQR